MYKIRRPDGSNVWQKSTLVVSWFGEEQVALFDRKWAERQEVRASVQTDEGAPVAPSSVLPANPRQPMQGALPLGDELRPPAASTAMDEALDSAAHVNVVSLSPPGLPCKPGEGSPRHGGGASPRDRARRTPAVLNKELDAAPGEDSSRRGASPRDKTLT